MNLEQLQAARDVLNIRALSRLAGLSASYLSNYMAEGRELPQDVQACLDSALRERGLEPRAQRPQK